MASLEQKTLPELMWATASISNDYAFAIIKQNKTFTIFHIWFCQQITFGIWQRFHICVYSFFLQREAQEAQNSFTTRPQTRSNLQFTLWHGNQSARGAFWDNFPPVFLTWTLPPFPMSTQMNSQGSGPTRRVPKDPWSATGSLHPNWARASPIFIWHHSVKGHTL